MAILSDTFEEIADRLKVSLHGVLAVGDTERDVIAARSVAAYPVLVRSGKGERTLKKSKFIQGVPVFADLADFVDTLLAGELITD